MKFKRIAFIALMALLAIPALAQNDEHTITFNNFSFSFDSTLASSVNITRFAGDSLDPEHPGGPEVAHTQFLLYSDPPVPTIITAATAAIRVYRTADFAFYEATTRSSPFAELQRLQMLLSERPDLDRFMEATEDPDLLPFMPRLTGWQIIRARAEYIDTSSLQGVSYVTVLRIDDSYPLLGSDFLYTFQGISRDGLYYVATISKLSTGLFPSHTPAEYDETILSQPDYLSQSIATLNDASPDDFTPSLDALDALVQTFSFGAGVIASPSGIQLAGRSGERSAFFERGKPFSYADA